MTAFFFLFFFLSLLHTGGPAPYESFFLQFKEEVATSHDRELLFSTVKHHQSLQAVLAATNPRQHTDTIQHFKTLNVFLQDSH